MCASVRVLMFVSVLKVEQVSEKLIHARLRRRKHTPHAAHMRTHGHNLLSYECLFEASSLMRARNSICSAIYTCRSQAVQSPGGLKKFASEVYRGKLFGYWRGEGPSTRHHKSGWPALSRNKTRRHGGSRTFVRKRPVVQTQTHPVTDTQRPGYDKTGNR